MSDNNDAMTAIPRPEPVRLTLELPARIARDYQALAAAGVWLSFEDAIRQAVIQTWKFERASYFAARLDLSTANDEREDETDKGQEPGKTPEA